jgi:glutamate decarboxylase
MTSLLCRSPPPFPSTTPFASHTNNDDDRAHQLRERGWVVPAYTMAPHSEKMKMLRVVVREDFTKSRCDALIADFKLALQTLDSLDEKKLQEQKE